MSQNLNSQLSREQQIAALEKDWATNPRWKGVKRGYSAADVVRLRGSINIEHTLAKRGAEKLWDKINGGSKKGYVNAFGAISAGQAMQQAKAGLEAVYLSGWQVAAQILRDPTLPRHVSSGSPKTPVATANGCIISRRPTRPLEFARPSGADRSSSRAVPIAFALPRGPRRGGPSLPLRCCRAHCGCI